MGIKEICFKEEWSRDDRDRYLKRCKKLLKKTERFYSKEMLDSLDSMSGRDKKLFMDCWNLFKDSMDYAEYSIKQIDHIEDQNQEIIATLSSMQKQLERLERKGEY